MLERADLRHCVVLLALDLCKPWTFEKALTKWTRLATDVLATRLKVRRPYVDLPWNFVLGQRPPNLSLWALQPTPSRRSCVVYGVRSPCRWRSRTL